MVIDTLQSYGVHRPPHAAQDAAPAATALLEDLVCKLVMAQAVGLGDLHPVGSSG